MIAPAAHWLQPVQMAERVQWVAFAADSGRMVRVAVVKGEGGW